MTTVGSTTTATSTSSTSSTSAASNAKTTLGSDFNTFLNMLTTQLQHQDPLSPMDSTQFTNQLVQFSMVEQQINSNSNLEKLITLQTNTQTAQATSYINQTVELSGTDLPLQGGSAAFSYTLPNAAKNVSVQIKDSTGSVVDTITGDTTTGRHDLSWDGKDSSGTQLKDGIYSVNIVATNNDGSSPTVTTTTYGVVTKVTNDPTKGTLLEMDAGTANGKVTTTLDKILSVSGDNSLANAQMTAASAEYQAATALYNSLNPSTSSTSSTSSSSATP